MGIPRSFWVKSRSCRFHTDEFILKITVRKVTESEQKPNRNRTEELPEKLTENIKKITEKASAQGEALTANRIKILELMMENPYISRADLAKVIGISETSVYRNIEMMRGKYLRRVGPDKGGFGEIIKDE
jgi:ATP-dependent DNA helicase RecG